MNESGRRQQHDLSCHSVGLLVRPEYAETVSTQWFDPLYWGDRSAPVDKGGRGSAWFIAHPDGDWVLRLYRRGGMVARINRDLYFHFGPARVRAFAEFNLLNELFEQGLPVPCPVAAWYARVGMFYRNALITRRIPAVQPFSVHLKKDVPSLWFRVGQVIRRFHDFGADHPDLNCDNILLSDEAVYLIDFDKGKLHSGGSRWKEANLKRLKRSVDKLAGQPEASARIARLWETLIEGYTA